jgi:sugar lactone lactonase YvrE
MADGFGRPNGIAFSSDQKTLYVGDTGALVGNGTINTTGPRTIYAFDIMGDGIQEARSSATDGYLQCRATKPQM